MRVIIVNIFLVLLCFGCSDKRAIEKISNPFYKKAYEYRDQGKTDSAFFYFNRAKDQFIQQKDSVRAANCMVNMAIISTNVGDLFGGQELSLDAIPYFNEHDPAHHPYLLSNYNNLGIASYNLRQYTKAIEFYKKSLEFIPDTTYALIVKNNIANAYRKIGKFAVALTMYQAILPREKNQINYARVLSNYAYTKWLQDSNQNTADELHKALQIRLKENDQWGQHASYAQLADYYLKKRPDSALLFSRKMYDLATNLNSADDRLEALQKLIPLSESLDSRGYFDVYRRLEDSLQIARNSAKNQFALIRYETEKHKADNLILQRQSSVRILWIISLSILLFAGGGFSYWWYKRRAKLLELAAKSAVRESQLKTSKKVHDVVANGIYRIMSEIENNEQLDQSKILDQMEILYERSRDISYEGEPRIDVGQNFQEIVRQLLVSFANAETKVVIIGNNDKLWECLDQQSKYELKQVLQELMVNMRKHSKSSSVVIRFERKDDGITIYYSDNGIGISDNIIFKNGLRNTGNRINSIGGNINFGTSTTGGLNIQIQIPAKF